MYFKVIVKKTTMMSQLFMLCTNNWESVDIDRSIISCIDIINKNIPIDNKCINVSNEYITY